MINTDCLNRINHHHHYHDHRQAEAAGAAANMRSHQMTTRRTSRNTLAKIRASPKHENSNSSSSSSTNMNHHHHSSISQSKGIECHQSALSSCAGANGAGNRRRDCATLGARGRLACSSSSGISSGGGGGGGRYAFIARITLTTFMVSLILLALVAREAQSLNCYTCSSADNPACDEQFSARANITDTDCEKQIGRPAKVCRKIIQYIEDKKVVIRSCGWIDERADDPKLAEKKSMCFKRSGTFALMMESCVCYEDNCNHSASLVPNQSVLTLLMTACSIYYFYLTKRISPASV